MTAADVLLDLECAASMAPPGGKLVAIQKTMRAIGVCWRCKERPRMTGRVRPYCAGCLGELTALAFVLEKKTRRTPARP